MSELAQLVIQCKAGIPVDVFYIEKYKLDEIFVLKSFQHSKTYYVAVREQ